MSKSCCFAFVFAVICLSLEADAQPTYVDETMTCSSNMLEVVVNKIELIQQKYAKKMRDEIRDVKKMITDVKKLCASRCVEKNETNIECDAARICQKNETAIISEPSKQALVSALVCEYLVCFQFDNTGST